MTPELRSAIYSLTQEELGLINSEVSKNIQINFFHRTIFF